MDAETARSSTDAALARAAELARVWVAGVDGRPVRATASLADLRARLGGPIPAHGEDPVATVEALVDATRDGLVASAGPRYFGFVIGGGLPAALAADWLAAAWDQNAAMYVMGPAAAVAEEVAGAWAAELFGLPAGVSAGFTTGATMASFTALAAGRHALLARAGWDVERDGLFGAPDLPVVVGEEAHVTIHAALQMLGLGRDRVTRVPTDGQGRMRPEGLVEVLAGLDRPALVCAQAGNVNTGAFDPLPAITDAVRANGGWLHVDGAFGLWAGADPSRRHLVAGIERADSWTTDAHKWLNVPYDSGLVFTADPAAHHAAMTLGAAYYVETGGAERDPYNWVAESSRRARGFAVWAAIRSLGRDGVAEMVARTCDHAPSVRRRPRRDARACGSSTTSCSTRSSSASRIRVAIPSAGDARTNDLIAAVQADGTMWLGGTTWHGMRAMRISVSGWRTTVRRR